MFEYILGWGQSATPSSSAPFKVLFCGEHMNAGYLCTKEALSSETGIVVVQCSRDDIMKEVKDAAVIVPLMSNISRDVIAAAPLLKLINQFGVGVEGVDLQAAREFGISVANIKSNLSGNAQSCAGTYVRYTLYTQPLYTPYTPSVYTSPIHYTHPLSVLT